MIKVSNKRQPRSEETKKAILSVAGKLFAKRGFDHVTMREIAKEAGCSHTTIHLYFKDKETLLHQLSMPPLLELKQRMEDILLREDLVPEDKLNGVSRAFIRFCLLNRNMYKIFFVTKAERVDDAEPDLAINKLRIELFNLLKRPLRECLHIQSHDERLLTYSRIFFFTLHGIVGTYVTSEETSEALLMRLESTFDDAIEVLLLGFKQQMKMEVERG